MATYWEKTAHSAYDMFSWYKYLCVNLVFCHLGFWSENLFLIAPFPRLCLLMFGKTFLHDQSCRQGLAGFDVGVAFSIHDLMIFIGK